MIEAPPSVEFDWKPTVVKPQVHYSSLDLLWRCGIAFKFRYIDKIRGGSSSAIHVGHAVDHAANVNLQSKIDTGNLLTVEQVLDLARDATVAGFDKYGAKLRPEEGDDYAAAVDHAVDKAVRLSRAHATLLAPNLNPKAVQEKFTIEIPGCSYDVVGTVDLKETNHAIHDLKTSAKSPSKTAAFNSDQGTLYSMAAFVIDKAPVPVTFTLDTIVDLKRETKVVTQESTRTMDDFRVMSSRLENAERVFQTGTFTPARQTDWWCSLQYCDYAPTCPYFRRPVTLALGEPEE